MKNKIIVFSVLTTFISCAKIGSPTGGAKDVTPPKIIKMSTPNFSTNFNQNSFELFFDEFVNIKNAEANVIVNPPLENKPEYILKGKSVLVKINNDLLPNTTYSFDFGKAIVDNNEGNPLGKFAYIFSTGNLIDSLSVFGNVIDILEQKPPEEEVFVLLYDNLDDTAFYNSKPRYYTRVDKFGRFEINNISEGTYNIFALEDKNSNIKYDQKFVERIAFLDESITIGKNNYYYKDTIITSIEKYMALNNISSIDSLNMKGLLKDSTLIDSVKKEINKQEANKISLELFKERKNPNEITQAISGYNRNEIYSFYVSFKKPLKENPEMKIISPECENCENGILSASNNKNDTLYYYLNDSSLIFSELILVEFKYKSTDSLLNEVTIIDSLRFSKRINKNKELPELKINTKTSNIKPLNKSLKIYSSIPLESFNKENIELIKIIDSTNIKEIEFEIIPLYKNNSELFNEALIKYQEDENANYNLNISPNTFFDIFNNTNDTIDVRYTTEKIDYYGRIILTINNVTNNTLIDLCDNSGKVLRNYYLEKDSVIDIKLLEPGFYTMRAYLDLNKNKIWDTGDLDEKTQPEPVIFYQGEINLRSNWDIEQTWNIKQ